MHEQLDPATLVNRLTTLSDMARLRMLRLLNREELSVGELARALQLPQSTVSRHLKLLHEGSWVIKRSEGTASLYRLVADALSPAAHSLWTLTSDQLGSGPTTQEDDSRLAEVLAERTADGRSFFGRLGADWDALRRDLFGDPFTDQALLALLDKRWVLADLGCGTGNAAAKLAPFVKTVIAVDREPAMLEAAKRRLEAFSNVDFRQGELHQLPIDNASVDAAMIFLVLHHLEQPLEAVREAARILRPGGALLIVDMVPHDREGFRHTMDHRHLGFSQETIESWAQATDLDDVRYVRLRPDTTAKGPGLFAATMRQT